MGFIFLIMAGGIFGWLAAIIVDADHRRGILCNATIGILGALVSGLVVGPLLGSGDLLAGIYDVRALIVAMVGSVASLIAVNILRPDVVR